jgi:hypothetical protein
MSAAKPQVHHFLSFCSYINQNVQSTVRKHLHSELGSLCLSRYRRLHWKRDHQNKLWRLWCLNLLKFS